MKKAIYTAIFGDYDYFKEPEYNNDDYDYHLFTDNRNIKSNKYTIHILNGDVRKAREIKLLHHKYLLDYDFSIWLDGNIIQKCNINQLADKQRADFMCMKHPKRNCIFDEANACLDMNKGNIETIQSQMIRYRKKGFPANMGLIASGILFRKHTKKVNEMCENWYKQLQQGSYRDLLSFNYILNQEIDLLPFSVLKTHFSYSGLHN